MKIGAVFSVNYSLEAVSDLTKQMESSLAK